MKTFNEVVDQLSRYIVDHLKPGIDAYDLAERLVSEKDRADDDDEINIEVPGTYTIHGNPIIETIDNYRIEE